MVTINQNISRLEVSSLEEDYRSVHIAIQPQILIPRNIRDHIRNATSQHDRSAPPLLARRRCRFEETVFLLHNALDLDVCNFHVFVATFCKFCSRGFSVVGWVGVVPGADVVHVFDGRVPVFSRIEEDDGSSVASSSNSSVQFKFEAELNAPQYENS